MRRIDDWTIVLSTFFIAFAGGLLFCLTAFAQPAAGKQLRFVFAGYRSAVVVVAGCSGAVQTVLKARQGGIGMNDYGVGRLYFNFDLDLSGWSDAEQQCVYTGLNSVVGKQ